MNVPRTSIEATYLDRWSIQWGRATAITLVRWFESQDFGHDCLDRIRVACCNDPVELAAYQERAREGCCGSVDTVLNVAGTMFRVGYNFGH